MTGSVQWLHVFLAGPYRPSAAASKAAQAALLVAAEIAHPADAAVVGPAAADLQPDAHESGSSVAGAAS